MSSSSMSRREGGVLRRAGLTVALALAILAVVPAIASAAGVVSTPTSSTILYTGSGSADNVIVDDPSVTVYTFAENLITETSTSCTLNTAPNPDVVTCTHATDWTAVTLNMGAGTDVVNASAVANDGFTINGGDDDDGNIQGTANNDTINGEGSSDDATATGLSGGPGNDTINGGAGVNGDIINGGDGNDRLIGEEGDDVFNGDAGIDRVLYSVGCSESPPTISIDIDGVADDAGCNSETADNVGTTVESVTGSTGIDTITGSCLANTIAGDPGSTNGGGGAADTINGDPASGCSPNGTDFMGGGEGNDIFDGDGSGTAGFDTVTYGLPYSGHAQTTATATGGSCSTAGSGFAVRVTLDGTANDCDGFGNTDNVHTDIERLIGSGLPDYLNGTGAAQGVQLFGRLGNDTLIGSPNGDFLDGEGGTDTLDCAGGTDAYRTDGGESISNCETQL
jgi:hypothetical protein